MSAQVLQTRRNTHYGEYFISSCVPALLCGCSPFAIPGLIISVIVDTVNGFTNRALAHILKEIWKGINPSLANCYTPPTIIWKFHAIRIQTPRFHILPRTICPRYWPPVTVFFSKAATGFRVARSEVLFFSCDDISTFAKALKSQSSAVFNATAFKLLYYFKSSKSKPDDRFSFSHNSLSLICAAFRDIRLSPGHFYFNNAIGVCN